MHYLSTKKANVRLEWTERLALITRNGDDNEYKNNTSKPNIQTAVDCALQLVERVIYFPSVTILIAFTVFVCLALVFYESF